MNTRFILLIVIAVGVANCSRPRLDIVLAARTELPRDEALTLTSPQPMRVVGPTNSLCLEPAATDSLNHPTASNAWGIRRPDGQLVLFGAALLGPDGQVDSLYARGYSFGTRRCLELAPAVGDTLRPPYTAVRVTASDSIVLAGVSWKSWTAM